MVFCDRALAPRQPLWYICNAPIALIRSSYAFLWGCKAALAALVLFAYLLATGGKQIPMANARMSKP